MHLLHRGEGERGGEREGHGEIGEAFILFIDQVSSGLESMKVSLQMQTAYYECVYHSFFITSKRTKHSILTMLHLNIQEMTKGNADSGYMHQRIIAPKFTGHESVRTGWNAWTFHCKTCVAWGRALA